MRNPFRKSYAQSELKLFQFLGKVNLFERLTYAEMVHFVPFLYQREYKADEVVFFRNDPSHALYVIKQGEVSLNIDLKESTETLSLAGAEQAFGANSLLSFAFRPYNAVVTSENASIYVIPQANIHDVFDENPKIRAKMITSLAEMADQYLTDLYKSYRASIGFFNLDQVSKPIY